MFYHLECYQAKYQTRYSCLVNHCGLIKTPTCTICQKEITKNFVCDGNH